MAIELQVLVQVVDSEPDNPMAAGILFKAQKITTVIASDGFAVADCIAIARSKMDTTMAEVSKDIADQLHEAEKATKE